MKYFLKYGISELGQAVKRTASEATSEASLRALRQTISRKRDSAQESARAVAHAPITQQAAVVVRTAASSGPVREVAVIHTGAEAGCGFVTSASGTAGTIAVYMVTGAMGPAALAAGMGASLGSRYLYRKVVGETLPGNEKDEQKEPKQDKDELMEDIGPKPQE